MDTESYFTKGTTAYSLTYNVEVLDFAFILS